MKRALILEFSPDQENLIDQFVNRLTTQGIKVVSGGMTATNNDRHIGPHFHYRCSCGWERISSLDYRSCPNCGTAPDVSPDGVVTQAVAIPKFVVDSS